MSTQRYGIPTKGRCSPFLDVTPRSQTPIRVLPPTPLPVLFAVLSIHSSTVPPSPSFRPSSRFHFRPSPLSVSLFPPPLRPPPLFRTPSSTKTSSPCSCVLVRLSRALPRPSAVAVHPSQKRRPLTRCRKPRNLVAIVSQRARSRPVRLSFGRTCQELTNGTVPRILFAPDPLPDA